MDEFLHQVWQDDVLPWLQQRSRSTRLGRAGVLAAVGAAIGEITDVICQKYLGRKPGFGALLGGTIGMAAGAFSPEILDWAAAYEQMSDDERESTDERIRQRVISRELLQLLAFLELPPTATLQQMKKAYKRQAFQLHPDRNRNPDAHVRMVALNAVREKLAAAYARGELPVNA